jgi:uncharacterized protein (TIGR00297 family)
MDETDRSTMGTVYFPASMAFLIWLFWDQARYLVAAGMMLMTWGDGMAAVIGQRFGKHVYTILGDRKSLQGSVAMFLFGWVSLLVVLALLSPLSPLQVLVLGTVTALFATLLEAISARGADNLTVPVIPAVLLFLMARSPNPDAGVGGLDVGPGAGLAGGLGVGPGAGLAGGLDVGPGAGLVGGLGADLGPALQVLYGMILAAVVAFLALRRGSLDMSGALGAVAIGTLVFGLGGWLWGILLVLFFVTSSLLSHFKERDKLALNEKFAKTGGRDLAQTLANGGFGALLALGFAWSPQPTLFLAYLGAMATVNADTWATEVGVLSKSPPRLITSLRVVPRGTSGGVTTLGTLATVVAAALIGVTGFLGVPLLPGVFPPGFDYRLLIWASVVGGVVGSLLDSLLGATVQAMFFCPKCEKETERAIHTCGTATRQARGLAWMNNDLVNFISATGGGLAAVLFINLLA